MSNTSAAVVERPSDQLPTVAEQPQTLLPAIIQAARDPAVDTAKLDALLKMQERLEERQAEKTFAAAFARLSAILPRVKKNGTIDLIDKNGVNKGSIAFAKWEDMDAVVRPLMVAHGFTLSFDSAPRAADGGGLIVTGTLMHVDGAKRTASIPLALDTGPGRNNLQAMGSSLSYGKRYAAEMLLNIVREGQDDDGKKGGQKFITDAQRDELQALIADTGADIAAFCKYAGVESLSEIPAASFVMAKNALLAKKQKRSAAS